MTGRVNEVDAYVLGYGQWVNDDLDDRLQLAVLEVEREMREAEFRALETILCHAADGELRFPDVDDLAEFGGCVRAAATLGWLGNDGANVDGTK